MFWLWTLFIALSGCMANRNKSLSTEAMSENNIYNLSRISIGMSEAQVLRIMHHPYSQKSFEHKGDVYDIWFYVIRVTGLDQSRLVPQNLTPLTFRNGVLIGWGYAYYNYLLKQEAIETQVQITAPPVQEKEENGIKKMLEAPPSPTQQQIEYPEKIIPIEAPPSQQQAPAQQRPQQQVQPPPDSSVTPRGPQQPLPPVQPKPTIQPMPPTQQAPIQQEPKQPPSPVQPPVEISSQPVSKNSAPLAMCSRPVQPPPLEEETPTDEKEDPYLDEKGDKMIEEENEQNFDFW